MKLYPETNVFVSSDCYDMAPCQIFSKNCFYIFSLLPLVYQWFIFPFQWRKNCLKALYEQNFLKTEYIAPYLILFVCTPGILTSTQMLLTY